MGERELQAALQEEAEGQVRQAWTAAEQAVAARRGEVAARLEQLRELAARRQGAAVARLRDDLLHRARQEARQVRLLAEVELAERMLRLAGALLPELAERGGDRLWQALYAELPPLAWARASVHPADATRAAATLPQAEVATAVALGGGLVVDSADGLIRIDNSLACRLARSWPDLLPQLLAALYLDVGRDATVDADTSF